MVDRGWSYGLVSYLVPDCSVPTSRPPRRLCPAVERCLPHIVLCWHPRSRSCDVFSLLPPRTTSAKVLLHFFFFFSAPLRLSCESALPLDFFLPLVSFIFAFDCAVLSQVPPPPPARSHCEPFPPSTLTLFSVVLCVPVVVSSAVV